MAERLNASPFITVPAPLAPERRAPDSIQFNLIGLSEDDTRAFAKEAAARGVKVQVFGLSTDNARAFWNWQFLADTAGAFSLTIRAALMSASTACPAARPAVS